MKYCSLLAMLMTLIAVVGCGSGGSGDLSDADIPRLGSTDGFVPPSMDEPADPAPQPIVRAETRPAQTVSRPVRPPVETRPIDTPPVDHTVNRQPVQIPRNTTTDKPANDETSGDLTTSDLQSVSMIPGINLQAIGQTGATDDVPEGPTDAEQVQADVRRQLDAFFKGDVDTLFSLMHSKIIDLLGGPTRARAVLTQSLERVLKTDLKAEEFDFPGPPQFLKTDLHHFAIVPTRSIFSLDGKRMETVNYQFGIRRVGRQKWTYIEGSRINHANVRQFFPDFPAGYRFPPIARRDPDAVKPVVTTTDDPTETPEEGDPTQVAETEPAEVEPVEADPAAIASQPVTEDEPTGAENVLTTVDPAQPVTPVVHTEPVTSPTEASSTEASPDVEPTVYRQDMAIGLTLEARQVQADVRQLLGAFFKGDAYTMLSYTHTKIIELMGGRAAAREKLEKTIKGLIEKEGLKLEAFGFPTPPEFLQSDLHRFTIVPTRGIFTSSGQRIESTNYQFGVRRVGQPGWMYIEGSRIGAKNVHEFFPDFPEGYKFPPIVQKALNQPKAPAESTEAAEAATIDEATAE